VRLLSISVVMILAIATILFGQRLVGKRPPFVTRNRSFHAVDLNDELVRAFEANKIGGAAVQILR
jgi:hypothetical protein